MNNRCSRGFALPTVLISSIIMLTVLLAAVSSTVATRVALKSQYYNQLAKDAGDAGVVYAKACLAANNGVPQWTDSTPLTPNTDCTGTQLEGFTCSDNSTDPRCSVNVIDSNIIVSFSVPAPLPNSSGAFTNITSNGSVKLLRSSDNSVWRQYNYSSKTAKVEADGLGAGVASSAEISWKQSESGYWKQIETGEDDGGRHTCAIASDNQAYCWGYNGYGQLGNNSTTNSSVPVAVNTSGVLSGLTIKSISIRYGHACAVASNNQAYCWGHNPYGQLGNNSTTNSSVPVAVNTSGVLSGLTIKSISTGINHTCAVASNDQAYCWGNNGYGQFGNNSLTNSSVPVAVNTSGVLSGLTIKSISVGGGYTCAIASNDQAYCWGNNGYGKLGNNSTLNSYVPVPVYVSGVLNTLAIKSITSGYSHTCAIASNDQAYCWGRNNYGQFGNNSTADSSVPIAVAVSGVLSGLTVKSIIAGTQSTCAIASNDQAYCWGYNTYGQLGDNSTTNSSVPVAVTTSGVLSGLTIKSIDTGDGHTCAIASNNQAYCWGIGNAGQLGINSLANSYVPVAVNDGVMNSISTSTITAGTAYNTCAIASNNQAYCWGHNNYGQLGNNSTIDSSIPVVVDTSGVLSGLTVKSISVGYGHACAIASNNQAYCWGRNTYGQLGNNSTTNSSVPIAVTTSGVLSGLTIKSISAGSNYTCAIASNDQAYCWGYNAQGQLGNNSTTNSSVPVAVTTTGVLSGLTIKSISTGGTHTCAIASNDQAYCWGSNNYGQLGNDTTIDSSIPVVVTTTGVLNGLTIKSISAGSSYTCAIASNDQAYCWGYNTQGQLGNNSTTNSSVPVAVTTTGVLNGLTIKSISVDSSYTCAIASNNQTYCWGYNGFGQLGDSSTTNSSVPVPVITSGVLNDLTIKSISVGGSYTCAIASNNQTYCWGYNAYGQLGNSSTTNSSVPVAVTTAGILEDSSFNPISAGERHTCTIASSNQAYCWGYNAQGQLGNNSTTNSSVPVAVTTSGVFSNLTIKSISVGSNYTCTIASNDQAYCWGYNYYGQLGNNSTTNSTVPVAVTTSGVLSGLMIRSIEGGKNHVCVIASNNQAYCWGYNIYGQLGNNSTTDSSVPIAVNTSGVLNELTIKSISSSVDHTCVIASNNQAYCWGYNAQGQLGNNSTTNSTVPVAVTTSGVLSGLTIKSIAVNQYHTCAIASNNQAYCWGYNIYGQLGNNSTTNSTVPVAVTTSGVLSGLTIKSITVGAYHTCVIASNNQAYCWGYNAQGQLGNNSTTNSTVPVAVTTSGVLSGLTIKSISAGSHTCAIAYNNQAYCWGYNYYGGLGDDSTTNSSVPVSVFTSGTPNVGWFNF
ncbi:MAG: hypothetical protein PWQ10_211 [Patescibacteria group bacterium]|nr:hypothetical protein [Patescibacteria group bacterium]